MEDIQNFLSCWFPIFARKITCTFGGFLARRQGSCPRLYPNKQNCHANGGQTRRRAAYKSLLESPCRWTTKNHNLIEPLEQRI